MSSLTEREDGSPTEYAKSTRFIVEKNQAPQELAEQTLQSNIPKSILPNVMMLGGIVNAYDKLTDSDVLLISKDGRRVTLYNNSDTQMDPADPSADQSGLVKYRSMSTKGYRDNLFWKEYWHGMLGHLMIALPAVDGGVRQDGVTMVCAITNSDRELLEAQNQGGSFVKKLWRKAGLGK